MNYILKGNPKEVAKVIQENRIRVDRGVIEFTPCQPETALDADSIATLREDLEAKTTACMEMAASQVELACIIDELVDVITEEGIAISEVIVERLAKFGVIVPKIAEAVPDNSEAVEDSKAIDAEDMKEVDLDDVKDVEENDSKEAPAPTPKKRSSKSKG